MSDLSIAAGLTQGLAEGFQSYMQTRNTLEEQALKKRLANAQGIDAYAKLYDVAGKQVADRQLSNLGLPQDLGQTAPTEGLVQSGMLPQQEAQAGQTGVMPGLDQVRQMGKVGREFYLKQLDPKYSAELEHQKLENQKLGREVKEGPKPTDNEFNAAGFAKRMEQSEKTFQDLMKKGYDPTTTTAGVQRRLPGLLQSSDVQQQEQAERNFVNAVLRRESGSAIQKSEFDSAALQYFPRAGDSPEVLQQKEINRRTAMATIKAAAGNAYGKSDTPTSLAAAAPPLSKYQALKANPDSLENKVAAGVRGIKSAFGTVAPNPTATAVTVPKVGTVEDGYRYMGGDMKKKSSWKKVK